jgi:hypothetical protein
MSKFSRVDAISDRDKLWELYLHTLAGYHGNMGANSKGTEALSQDALKAAEMALKVWKERG